MHSIIIASALTLTFSLLTSPTEEAIHLKAKEISRISNHENNGLTLPKVYVLSTDGSLLLDGAVNASSELIISTINSFDLKTKYLSSPIKDILHENKIVAPYGGAPLLVIFSAGASMDRCSTCDEYNSNLIFDLNKSKAKFRLIHIFLERNN